MKKNEKELIDECKIVSFDIFDTLITRNLEKPTDIFDIIQKNTKLKEFKKNRIIAEQIARNKINYEITLEQIYDELINIYEDYDEVIRTKQKEIEIEIVICQQNINNINLYNYALEKEKEIIIVSDMYLPKNVIISILYKNKIKFSKLFLSSELKMTKSKGDIFDYIIKELNVKYGDIVHIGDNIKSDCKIPHKKGIKTIHIKNEIKRCILNAKFNTCHGKFLENYLNNNENIYETFSYRLGYETLGPLLYGFAVWLKEKIANNYDKIFFLARDGKIILNAFEIIKVNVKKEYMYGSRRSLIVPSLWDCNTFEELISTMFLENDISVKSFLKKIGLDNNEKYKVILNKYGYDFDSIVNFKDSKIISNFSCIYKELKEDIIINSKEEYNNLISYLEKINFKGNVAIVDIGWFGNMQLAMQKLIEKSNINVNIDGYYIGIVPFSLNQNKLNMQGYLFEKNKNEDLFWMKKYFNSLFEMFFSTNHGSVRRFCNNGVELYEYEYKDSEEEKVIKQIQQGALDFVREFHEYNDKINIELSEYECMVNFLQLGNNPTNEILDNFEKFNFYDDDYNNLVIVKSKFFYFKHFKCFMEDLKKSQWQTGFLKKVVGLNINYYKIISFLRKISR